MSLHDDHRNRMRDRVRQEGLDGFTEYQFLELLLFYTIPQADTNPLAHRLMDRFGSLQNIFHASEKELMEVEGIGKQSAFFLHLMPQVVRFYRKNTEEKVKIADTSEKYIGLLKNQFTERLNENVYLLCMDAKRKVLGCERIGEGSVNSANAPMRKILEVAIRLSASMAVLAHNHPGGLAVPSREDIQVTHFVASVLQSVDVVLVDHVIIAGDDAVSLRESDLYDPDDYGIR